MAPPSRSTREILVAWIEADNQDPKVSWHENSSQWVMALYLKGERYCLLTSTDALNWRKIQDLELEGDHECPDFFPIPHESGEERWVSQAPAAITSLAYSTATTSSHRQRSSILSREQTVTPLKPGATHQTTGGSRSVGWHQASTRKCLLISNFLFPLN